MVRSATSQKLPSKHLTVCYETLRQLTYQCLTLSHLTPNIKPKERLYTERDTITLLLLYGSVLRVLTVCWKCVCVFVHMLACRQLWVMAGLTHSLWHCLYGQSLLSVITDLCLILFAMIVSLLGRTHKNASRSHFRPNLYFMERK